MTTTNRSNLSLTHSPEKAITLALSLAQAERAIHEFTLDQADAVMDADGRTYLLRPAQERLRQNERRLQAILDSAGDVIMVVDRAGVILSTSRAISQVLGYGPEELVGRSIFELVFGDDLNRLYSAFFNVIEGMQESATAQFYHPTKDGSSRMMEASVGKLREDSPASAVFILRPVASPRPPPAEPPPRAIIPEDASRAKDRFLAMIAHELRTPRPRPAGCGGIGAGRKVRGGTRGFGHDPAQHRGGDAADRRADGFCLGR